MPTETAVRIAHDTLTLLAPPQLTEHQAVLYSQSIRRQMGREGLARFRPDDVWVYLDEAATLIQSALLERAAQPAAGWQSGVKRAGELLEWLSQRDLQPRSVPTHLLAAAAYQLSGYPALALGHVRQIPQDAPTSTILKEFLRADFPATIRQLYTHWRHEDDEHGDDDPNIRISKSTIDHVISCIGVVCAYLRSGDADRVERAVEKLSALASNFVHSRDSSSWMLAKLTAEVARVFVSTSLWAQIALLKEVSSARASRALDQFVRASFVNRRALIWPSQERGVQRLRQNDSFVMCTPTGSGKTTVATLAIIQSLFSEPPEGQAIGFPPVGNLVLYLVPSRALASEVETRLGQDLDGIDAAPVTVTGLYGGTDWGPTDAWIAREDATVVICTFEKADALIRYLGVLFLNRVRLVVIDEAHMVEFSAGTEAALEQGGSRAYRLEMLGTRLLQARDSYDFRVVALSAVAAGAGPAIARWLASRDDAAPVSSEYRSTRQMLGRLEVSARGAYQIVYDLMDGHSLQFRDAGRYQKPFVASPFAPLPDGLPNEGPDKRMRAPTLWAALHLAARRRDGTRPTVLISITQHVEAFTSTALSLLESWDQRGLPDFFAAAQDDERWIRCLECVSDYFSEESVEYRLLRRGIAVHHGKMPSLLARRLKVVIDSGLINVVIATSTLSEGVNIPVNYLLVPSVFRATSRFSLNEFGNLIGRVGRPGVATEGHALVVLQEGQSRQRRGYESLLQDIEGARVRGQQDATQANSALQTLLVTIEQTWRALFPGGTDEQFYAWLEQTGVVAADETPAVRQLDSLDSFIIGVLQELEDLRGAPLQAAGLEDVLIAAWRKTYAYVASLEEARLRSIWLRRGRAVMNLYPDPDRRRRIYKTSLTPRSATIMLDRAADIRGVLEGGRDYATLDIEGRLSFVRDVVELLGGIPAFSLSTSLGRARNFTDWPMLLRWWLAPASLETPPRPDRITTWFEYVASNFIYRATWGLGSVLALMFDNDEEAIRPLDMDDWPRTGLPWIAFWLKELLSWGTLDPVAAYLLARGNAVNRRQAEADAEGYYASLEAGTTPNDQLDPRRIRDWLLERRARPAQDQRVDEYFLNVELSRPRDSFRTARMQVFPIEVEARITWKDAAGYTVAMSDRPENWVGDALEFMFELESNRAHVTGHRYLRRTG